MSRDGLPPAAPLPAVLQTLAMRRWPLSCLARLRRRYGSCFRIRIPDLPPLVFLSDPEDINAVLTAPARALGPGAGTFTLAPLMGPSSFMLRDGEEHAAIRGLLAPAFARGAPAEHSGMVSELARDHVASWPVGKPLALHTSLRELTLSVVTEGLISDMQPRMRELNRRLLEMLSVTTSLVLLEPKLRHLPPWRAKWERLERQRAALGELAETAIGQFRRDGSDHAEVLEALLRARAADGSELSAREIADNLLSLLLAGHETTASMLAWAFQMLAHNPSVQKRLTEEIDAGAGEEYLEATVLETLRHAPVFVFTIPRAVAEPIEIGGFTYRPPTLLMACTYLMHHDPTLYADPNQFRPERFLGQTPDPHIWAPWGGGRRRCLGQHLAVVEMRSVLREVLSTRSVLPANKRMERARWRTAILAPADGARVVLLPRTPHPSGPEHRVTGRGRRTASPAET
jgi:cytochrome P450 family 135